MKAVLSSMIVLLVIGSVPGQSRVTDEEYEIYGLVLTKFFRDRNERNSGEHEKHFVIASKTGVLDPATFIAERRTSLYKSFYDRNKSQASFQRRFPVRFSYSLVDEPTMLASVAREESEYRAEQERLRGEGKLLGGGTCGPEWKWFHERFPKSFGYYRVSKIGFSRDHRLAYLEIVGKGSTWEEYAFYWLRWTRRGWRTEKASGGGGAC